MKPTHPATSLACVFTLLAVAAASPQGSVFARRPRARAAGEGPHTLRLRSFKRGLTGSLHFGRAAAGDKVLLTAMSLPPPASFAAGARSYVVWAVKSGAPALRLGELQPGASGNGGLEFASPWQSGPFSVLVTAEPAPLVLRPAGAVALAARIAGSQPYAAEDRPAALGADPQVMRRLRRRLRSRAGSTGYFREIESAIDRRDGGRFLALAGDEAASEAYGAARAAMVERQAYVHALIARLPARAVGAHVLWAVEPGGRMIYMGSVPVGGEAETELHARVGGVGHEDFDLVVTAEMRRGPSVRPGPRALSTQHPAIDPVTGVQGFSIKKKQ